MSAYYNEYDSRAAAWLRQLIKNGLIADGEVDERSIIDVEPSDVKGFTQCHWFAGIGGWSAALRLAGWSDDRPVWTASLPCQPFSVAGNQKGKDDERHLLPHYLELVKQCRPTVQFGEQVPAALRHGWLCDLYAEMEACNYAVGSIIVGAHSVGSYHQRQRLYWVANSNGIGCDSRSKAAGQETRVSARSNISGANNDWVADTCDQGSQEQHSLIRISRQAHGGVKRKGFERGRRMGNTEHDGRFTSTEQGCNGASICCSEKRSDSTGEFERTGSSRAISERGLGNSNSNRLQEWSSPTTTSRYRDSFDSASWNDPDWLYCRDNKYRPIKPSSIKMASRISRGMVCCCNSGQQINDENKEGEINANASKTDSGEILRSLQGKTREEAHKRKIRGFDGIQEKEVLQSRLHGERSGNGCCDKPESQQDEIDEVNERLLRGVWKDNYSTCSSCGRKSFQQLPIEFDDVVYSMPQGSTLAQFFCSDGSEYMQVLRKTSDENRALLDSQYSAKEVWESLNDEEKDRVRVHFNNRGWVFTEGLKPLVDGVSERMVRSGDNSQRIDADNTQEARVMRLKGYGNAICVPVAAQFIKAFMEVS